MDLYIRKIKLTANTIAPDIYILLLLKVLGSMRNLKNAIASSLPFFTGNSTPPRRSSSPLILYPHCPHIVFPSLNSDEHLGQKRLLFFVFSPAMPSYFMAYIQ